MRDGSEHLNIKKTSENESYSSMVNRIFVCATM